MGSEPKAGLEPKVGVKGAGNDAAGAASRGGILVLRDRNPHLIRGRGGGVEFE